MLERHPMTTPAVLTDLLACPKCHGALRSVEGPSGLVCEACKLFFSLDEGLPNMLIEEARSWPLSPASPASPTSPASPASA
jgi:uncharacterized protein YbaR (Trm112 family)